MNVKHTKSSKEKPSLYVILNRIYFEDPHEVILVDEINVGAKGGAEVVLYGPAPDAPIVRRWIRRVVEEIGYGVTIQEQEGVIDVQEHRDEVIIQQKDLDDSTVFEVFYP